MADAPKSSQARLSPTIWLGIGCLLAAGLWLGIAAVQPKGAESLQLLNRWLVRFGLPFFVLAFSASSLARLWPSPFTKRLLRERRGFGLAYAAIHLTHAAAIVVLWSATDMGPEMPAVAVGGLGFVLTLAMALTSTDAAVKRMGGRNWRRLHTFGIRYLMFIYLVSYGGGAAEGNPWKIVAFALLLGLVGLRVAAGWKGRMARRAPARA